MSSSIFTKPTQVPIPCITDLSTVFSTLDMDMWLKIRRHDWKEPLKISQPAKFSIAWENKIGVGEKKIDHLLQLARRYFPVWPRFLPFPPTAEPSPRLSFQMIPLKRAKIELRKVAKIYRRLYSGGGRAQIIVPHHTRLQNSPYFCVFKYARAVKQKVWNEAENRERD